MTLKKEDAIRLGGAELPLKTLHPVERQIRQGRLFDEAKETIRIVDGECEDFLYPYMALKLEQAAKRGVEIKAIVGPVIAVRQYKAGELEKYIEHYSKNGKVSEYQKIGDSFIIMEEWDNAIYAFEKAFEESKNACVLTNLSYAFSKKGEFQKCLECARKSRVLDPKDFIAWGNIGYALLKMKKFDEAVRELEDALKFVDEHNISVDRICASNMFNNLGDVYKAEGRFNEAVRMYGQVLYLDPLHEGTYENLMKVHERMTNEMQRKAKKKKDKKRR